LLAGAARPNEGPPVECGWPLIGPMLLGPSGSGPPALDQSEALAALWTLDGKIWSWLPTTVSRTRFSFQKWSSRCWALSSSIEGGVSDARVDDIHEATAAGAGEAGEPWA
jgi:hypothetical protein